MTFTRDQWEDMLANRVVDMMWDETTRLLRQQWQREMGAYSLRRALRRCSGCRIQIHRGLLRHGYCFRCRALVILATVIP